MKAIMHRKTFERNINQILFVEFNIIFDKGCRSLASAILKTAASSKEFAKAFQELNKTLRNAFPWYMRLWFRIVDFFMGEKQYKCHKCKTIMFQCSGWGSLAAYECPKCEAWVRTKNGKIYHKSQK